MPLQPLQDSYEARNVFHVLVIRKLSQVRVQEGAECGSTLGIAHAIDAERVLRSCSEGRHPTVYVHCIVDRLCPPPSPVALMHGRTQAVAFIAPTFFLSILISLTDVSLGVRSLLLQAAVRSDP
jgi:hypothetical protein